MIKERCRCFLVEVGGVEYVVKYGHIDEFVCLFPETVVVISRMITSDFEWKHKFQWYKRI